jgi:hypothetical protein
VLREEERAMKLLPVAKDSVKGPHMIKCFALIAAWMGKGEVACDPAWHRAQLWSIETFALLGSVAGRPEVRKIVASLAPK